MRQGQTEGAYFAAVLGQEHDQARGKHQERNRQMLHGPVVTMQEGAYHQDDQRAVKKGRREG
ncbi:MAG: hypothetical protein DDT36_01716 [Firmicutes bacterium]|nr:hypothetical protein [Bacillota bacterium]